MEIINISDVNLDHALGFLNRVQLNNSLDEEILKNGSMAIENDEVCAVLSFEKFSNYGLIRYFVFKKDINEEVLLKLFSNVLEKIKENKIDFLLSLIVKEELLDLFINLGFKRFDKNYFFIEEKNILETNFADAYVLLLNVN